MYICKCCVKFKSQGEHCRLHKQLHADKHRLNSLIPNPLCHRLLHLKPSSKIQCNITLLPSVKTIALGIFCGAKYTHHTFSPVIKHHYITTTANKHPGKKSFIRKHMRNPTDISYAYLLFNYALR